MRLRCPHGRGLNKNKQLGIIAYSHLTDGQDCHFMNKFASRVNGVVRAMIKQSKFQDSHVVGAIVASSEGVRKDLYRLVERSNNRQQVRDIMGILQNAAKLNANIQYEIITEFGSYFAHCAVKLGLDDFPMSVSPVRASRHIAMLEAEHRQSVRDLAGQLDSNRLKQKIAIAIQMGQK